MTPEVLLTDLAFGESPRWHDGRVWIADWGSQEILVADRSGNRESYKTVNGVPATGGSLDGPGPVVVGGLLFVNSGYGFIGGMPGNVLLAFSVDGR